MVQQMHYNDVECQLRSYMVQQMHYNDIAVSAAQLYGSADAL
jgi:hypothetical protein